MASVVACDLILWWLFLVCCMIVLISSAVRLIHWRCLLAQVDESKAQHPFGLFLDHVRDRICNSDPEKNEFLLNALAQAYQHPASHWECLFAFCGDEGSGKSLTVEYFGRPFGKAFRTLCGYSAVCMLLTVLST